MALIRCSECNNQVSTNATACPHCGNPLKNSEFPQTISTDNKPVAQKKNNHHSQTQDSEMKFDGVCTIKNEITKDQFIRRLMIHLTAVAESSVEISKLSFGEVVENYKEVILCNAFVESNYTVSIGYERDEEYWDKEKNYISATRWEYVDVKRTRTVTDWQPHSGHVADEATSLAFNERSDLSGEDQQHLLKEVLSSINKNSIVAEGTAKISAIGLETAKSNCIAFVESEISLPGDDYKDFNSISTIDVKELFCYKLPYYEVDFVYDDQTFHASGFACNESQITTELPENNDDIASIAEEGVAKYGIFKSIAWGTFILLFSVSFVLCFVSEIAGLFTVLTIIAFIVAIGLHSKYINQYNDFIKQLKADYMQIKIDELQKALKENNYDELTTEEIALFDVATLSEEYLATHKKTGLKLPIIFGSIAVILLLILILA